jgi:hypothetical protein
MSLLESLFKHLIDLLEQRVSTIAESEAGESGSEIDARIVGFKD